MSVRTDLTPRQRQVLTLAAQGYSNRQIAAHLHIAYKTAKNQLYNVYQHYGTHSRVHTILAALEAGDIRIPILPRDHNAS